MKNTKRRLAVALVLVAATSWATAAPPELLSDKVGGFDLSWYTIDSGRLMSSGGYSLTGTLGQPDAGKMSGGVYSLSSGFHRPAPVTPEVFGDGFESGDFSAWSTIVGNR